MLAYVSIVWSVVSILLAIVWTAQFGYLLFYKNRKG